MQYNKTMKNTIASNATKLTLIKTLAMAITMLIAMLLSRFRSLEEYGTYSQMQLIGNLVTSIFMVGLPNSISYFISKNDKIKRQEFLNTFFSLCSLLGTMGGILLILAIPIASQYFNNRDIMIYWFFLLSYPWTKITLASIENLLVSYNKIEKLMVFKGAYCCITLLTLIVCCIIKTSFYIYMIAFTCSEVVFSIWVYSIASKVEGRLKFQLRKHTITSILRYSLPIGLSSIVSTISIELDKLLIGWFYNTNEMAIYVNASRELPITVISTAISAVLMPPMVKFLAKGKNKEAVELWKKSVILSYIFISFIVMILFVYAKEVIAILYSSKYIPGIGVFRVYTLVLLLRVTYFGIILNSIGKTRFILYSSLISLGLNVILNIVCYYVFGFIGPAIATFLSIGIIATIQLWYSANVINMHLKDIFPWGSMVKIFGINTMFGIVLYYISNFILLKFLNAYIIAIGAGIIAGGVYLFVYRKRIFALWNYLNNIEVD